MSKEKTPIESKAKQEAERIVDIYDDAVQDALNYIYNDKRAIKCALIQVERIIDELKEFENSLSGYGLLKIKGRISFMQEVKQELNKML